MGEVTPPAAPATEADAHFATVREGLRTPPRPCLDCSHDHCFCEERKVKGGAALDALVSLVAATEQQRDEALREAELSKWPKEAAMEYHRMKVDFPAAEARVEAAEKERDEAWAACKKAIRERRSLEIKEDDWHSAYESAERRAAEADDLLRRLSEWDMLYVRADGVSATGDAPYWQGEIARCRAALSAGCPERTTT